MGGQQHERATWFLVGAMVLTVLVSACSQDQTSVGSPVSEEEVTEMAENALKAFNDADYASWSRDWSDIMKAAIEEDAFLAFRDQAHAQLGNYVAINDVTGSQGEDPGTYRWTFDVEFENGPYVMWFGFKEGSKLIEGVTFEEPGS